MKQEKNHEESISEKRLKVREHDFSNGFWDAGNELGEKIDKKHLLYKIACDSIAMLLVCDRGDFFVVSHIRYIEKEKDYERGNTSRLLSG